MPKHSGPLSTVLTCRGICYQSNTPSRCCFTPNRWAWSLPVTWQRWRPHHSICPHQVWCRSVQRFSTFLGGSKNCNVPLTRHWLYRAETSLLVCIQTGVVNYPESVRSDYQVNQKKIPLRLLLILQQCMGIFVRNFTRLLSDLIYTLSPSFIEIFLELTKLHSFNHDNPHFTRWKLCCLPR